MKKHQQTGARMRKRRVQTPEENSAVVRPSLSRMYEIAAGLSAWTAAEEEWVRQHPEWSGYVRRIRKAIDHVRKESVSAFSELGVGSGI